MKTYSHVRVIKEVNDNPARNEAIMAGDVYFSDRSEPIFFNIPYEVAAQVGGDGQFPPSMKALMESQENIDRMAIICSEAFRRAAESQDDLPRIEGVLSLNITSEDVAKYVDGVEIEVPPKHFINKGPKTALDAVILTLLNADPQIDPKMPDAEAISIVASTLIKGLRTQGYSLVKSENDISAADAAALINAGKALHDELASYLAFYELGAGADDLRAALILYDKLWKGATTVPSLPITHGITIEWSEK